MKKISGYKPLTFDDLDDLAFAAASCHLKAEQIPVDYRPRDLGPLIEFFHLASKGRLPPPQSCIFLDKAEPILNSLNGNNESWICPDSERFGFIRALRTEPEGDRRFMEFLMKVEKAGREKAGLPVKAAGQLAAAMQELENNIHEHSNAPETGFVIFRAAPGIFEFVVRDHGIGILDSLRTCQAYASLTDHGKALELALKDGVSRFGSNNLRGYGFRQIFIGLVNLRGHLRFRTGDHALTMDGRSPELATAVLAQKSPIDGFFVSVKVTNAKT